uniref:Putative conserved secreted protein n=1 Tax=Nyssomyia neivai TaxID=330878 RepID=A0A1L8DNP9_9DIPT
MLVRLVCRLVMPAGSCTALSTEFNLMVRCHRIRRLAEAMTPSTPSSVRLGPGSTSHVLCLSTWNPLWWMKCAPEHTGSSSTLSN